MVHYRFFASFILFLSMNLVVNPILYAFQDSTSSHIQISSEVKQTQIPLNRTMKLKVTISWIGDSERFDVIKNETNSSLRVEAVSRIINKKMLVEIAATDEDFDARNEAINKIFDQTIGALITI